MFIQEFLSTLKLYTIEVLPPLVLGLLASGFIYEWIPNEWIKTHLGKKGWRPLFYSTAVGTVMPVCCWGSLPLAVSFYQKGSSLGSILAFLVATPATSITALFMVWKFFGLGVMIYVAFAVIVMGMTVGVIGNTLRVTLREQKNDAHHHDEGSICPSCQSDRPFGKRVKSALYYSLVKMPREIGWEAFLGIVLAALVEASGILGIWIENYLSGSLAYLFTVLVGMTAYMCSTMSVPLVYALIHQGMNEGAGLALLILGPIASYGTLLILRKTFGWKVLSVFVATIISLSLLTGFLFEIIAL